MVNCHSDINQKKEKYILLKFGCFVCLIILSPILIFHRTASQRNILKSDILKGQDQGSYCIGDKKMVRTDCASEQSGQSCFCFCFFGV